MTASVPWWESHSVLYILIVNYFINVCFVNYLLSIPYYHFNFVLRRLVVLTLSTLWWQLKTTLSGQNSKCDAEEGWVRSALNVWLTVSHWPNHIFATSCISYVTRISGAATCEDKAWHLNQLHQGRQQAEVKTEGKIWTLYGHWCKISIQAEIAGQSLQQQTCTGPNNLVRVTTDSFVLSCSQSLAVPMCISTQAQTLENYSDV